MKVLAVLMLCAFVAVQARSAAVKNTKSVAALGENPWVVHLRIAVSTSGYLNTCVGSLIDNRWVLTAASCVGDARFIWVRYGTVNVINPELVTENSAVRTHPTADIALVSLDRYVEARETISPVSLIGKASAPDSATFCGFSTDGGDAPGEELNCFEVDIAENIDEDQISKFDTGAPVVSDGVQIALVSAGADGVLEFLATSDYVSWIESEIGAELSRGAVASPTVEEPSPDSLIVQFAN